jgi:hypothetical protein
MAVTCTQKKKILLKNILGFHIETRLVVPTLLNCMVMGVSDLPEKMLHYFCLDDYVQGDWEPSSHLSFIVQELNLINRKSDCCKLVFSVAALVSRLIKLTLDPSPCRLTLVCCIQQPRLPSTVRVFRVTSPLDKNLHSFFSKPITLFTTLFVVCWRDLSEPPSVCIHTQLDQNQNNIYNYSKTPKEFSIPSDRGYSR